MAKEKYSTYLGDEDEGEHEDGKEVELAIEEPVGGKRKALNAKKASMGLKVDPELNETDYRSGYCVLPSYGVSVSDPNLEVPNVYGANEEQEKSDEDHTSWIDALTDTHNNVRFSDYEAKLKSGKN